MKKTILLTITSFAFLILMVGVVSAHCPLCTGAAIAGVGAARFLGVDDSIVGLLVGAVIASSALWFNKFLKKKNINFPFQETILVIVSFLLFVVPFYTGGLITDFDMVKSMPEHHSMLGLGIYGIDRLLFGITIGTLLVWGAFGLSDAIKKKRGKVLWPFQGLSFMGIALGITALVFWLITK